MRPDDDGGSAFPMQFPQTHNMTMRDWFAGQAILTAAMSVSAATGRPSPPSRDVAARAYAIADAMLAERRK